MNEYIDILDWRREVGESYAAVRLAPEERCFVTWQDWREKRNDLCKNHRQSPLSIRKKANFQALRYYDYDPTWRVTGNVDSNIERKTFYLDLAGDGDFNFTRIARIFFEIAGKNADLSLFWIEGYGGGLFLPFKDATNGTTTFGGGRYLIDTIKGADLGASEATIELDFNFSYNPSCAYHPRWVCPLSPPENTLSFAVTAGEMLFDNLVIAVTESQLNQS